MFNSSLGGGSIPTMRTWIRLAKCTPGGFWGMVRRATTEASPVLRSPRPGVHQGAENIHPRVKHHRKIGSPVMEGRTLEGRYVRVISAASDKDGSSMLR